MAPVNPPGSHPIAAPITVVISGPMAPMTILSGDGSAILLPARVGNLYSGSVWCRYGFVGAHGAMEAGGPRGQAQWRRRNCIEKMSLLCRIDLPTSQ
jgi:hypothetical protein